MTPAGPRWGGRVTNHRRSVMRRQILACVVLGGLAVVSAVGEEARKGDKQLQGAWNLVGGESEGMKIPEDALKDMPMTITFTGNKYRVTSGEKVVEEGTYTTDAKKDP